MHRCAVANDRYDLAIKNALSAAGGTGFTFPACAAAAYVSGSSYTAGQQASYQGCVSPSHLLRTCHPRSSFPRHF